jgi:hypothetical protein
MRWRSPTFSPIPAKRPAMPVRSPSRRSRPRETWLPQIERLVAAYRELGVRSAETLELQVIELTPRLAQATVHWGLVDHAGGPIYEFDASYTLADLGDGLRITAIAHNETPRLRAAIQRQPHK